MQVGSVSDLAAAQAAQTRQRTDIAVLGKAQDSAKAQGEAIIALIESAASAIGHGESDGHDESGHHGLDVTA